MTKYTARKLRITTIREVLLVVTLLSVAFGWYRDHGDSENQLAVFRMEAAETEVRLDAINSIDELDGGFALLIFALTDPHFPAAQAADRALRRLSGLSQGFGDLAEYDELDRLKTISQWIEWYIRREREKHGSSD